MAPNSRNDVNRARQAWAGMLSGFEALATAGVQWCAAATRAGETFRRAFDPAVTWDRRRARRMARRFGGRFVVERWKGRRVYVLTGAAATRAIEAGRGRGAW